MVQRISGEGRLGSDIPVSTHQESEVKEAVIAGKRLILEQDASSLIADAAEELTFEASETVEVKLEERRTEKERPSEVVRRIKELQAMIQDLNEERLRRWLENLHLHPPRSTGDLRDSLQKAFADISHQHAALSLLEEFYGDNPTLQVLAREAKAQLEAEAESSIRAGYNISATAQAYAAQGLGDTQDLRNFYRQTVLHYEGVTQTFESILQKFPSESLLDAVAYLLRAVGTDLHARGPSIEREELRAIMDDLFHLESIANLYRSFDQLLQRTRRNLGVPVTLDAKNLVGEFLSLTDKKWITETDILNIVKKTSIEAPSARIYFLQGFLDLTRQAPLKLFSSDEGRLMLISKTQEVLDQFIEEEAQ